MRPVTGSQGLPPLLCRAFSQASASRPLLVTCLQGWAARGFLLTPQGLLPGPAAMGYRSVFSKCVLQGGTA